jgi:hypothetical protein
MNALIEAQPGAAGTYIGLEVDVNSLSTSADMVGILVAGNGSGVNKAVEIVRSDATQYETGLSISNSRTGLKINPTLESVAEFDVKGLQVGEVEYSGQNIPVAIRQISTAHPSIRLQRWSDTVTTGNAIDYLNSAGNAIVWKITNTGVFEGTGVVVNGAMFATGTIQAVGSLIGSSLNIGGTAGASGTFTTADGKTVTVTGGCITGIV